MREFNKPEKIIRLIKMCYNNMRCRVKIGGEVTDSFEVYSGLKQGCALSTILFNLVLEWVMRQTPQVGGIHIVETRCDRLAYADDIDFCRENIQEIDRKLNVFREAASEVGLEINETKTKVLKVSRQNRVFGNIRCGNMELEAVESFKYLGSMVTAENRVEEEVKQRIAAAARCSWALTKVFNSNILSRRTKVRAYAVIVRPVLTYGCETWRLTKDLERKLEVFENGILRKICGPVFDAGIGQWRRRHNYELREMTEVPLITSIIMAQRLRWAGHVARADEDRLISKIARGQPEGRRPTGRPRMRWSDNVKKDMMKLGVDGPTEWWDIALDRGRWKLLVTAAKSHGGP